MRAFYKNSQVFWRKVKMPSTLIVYSSVDGHTKKICDKIEMTISKSDQVDAMSIDDALNREQLELFTDRLSWFDQTVFRLWLNGENISELSRESGIALETLHTSLHRTKKKIKDAFSNLRDKKPKT